jgi:hypothetical protein
VDASVRDAPWFIPVVGRSTIGQQHHSWAMPGTGATCHTDSLARAKLLPRFDGFDEASMAFRRLFCGPPTLADRQAKHGTLSASRRKLATPFRAPTSQVARKARLWLGTCSASASWRVMKSDCGRPPARGMSDGWRDERLLPRPLPSAVVGFVSQPGMIGSRRDDGGFSLSQQPGAGRLCCRDA